MLAFLALVKAKLHTAAEYELWLDDQHYKEVAMPLYGGSRYPWPLSEVLCWLKRRQVAARVLKGTFDLTPEQVRVLGHACAPSVAPCALLTR